MAPEGRGIFRGLTVEENLVVGMHPCGLRAGGDLQERLEEAYARFPILGERRGQQASNLSGGEAAMLAIGRALMSRPALALLDEPTLGLAPLATERLFEHIATLKRDGQSLLIVEQRARQLLDIADRVLVILRGRAVVDARASELTLEQLHDLYFGSTTSAVAGANP
jgi:branched-chain amino acid transport system ATP-binding protein